MMGQRRMFYTKKQNNEKKCKRKTKDQGMKKRD